MSDAMTNSDLEHLLATEAHAGLRCRLSTGADFNFRPLLNELIKLRASQAITLGYLAAANQAGVDAQIECGWLREWLAASEAEARLLREEIGQMV